MIIKRVGPLSCAKITGTLYALIGLLIGAIMSMAAMAGAFASQSNSTRGFGALFGVAAIVVFPICYGALGFVATLIAAWLYNVLAGLVGGIHIELEQSQPQISQP